MPGSPDNGFVFDEIPTSNEEGISEAIKNVLGQIGEEQRVNYLEIINANTSRLNDFKISPRSIPEGAPPFLIFLRQWNSFTPILPSKHEARGGGYFVFYENYGLVIDPGFNFVRNFLECGFKLSDINGIMISHAHNDHSVELEAIFSLLYKKNRENGYTQKIDLFMNLGSFKKYSPLFDMATEGQPTYLNKIVLMNPHQKYYIGDPESNFVVFTTKAKHHEMITANYALGFVFKFGERTLRLTGDTGWSSELENENIKILSNSGFIKGESVDILIAHLGSIKEEEFSYDFSVSLLENELKKDEQRVFYKDHLGILGCICMMARWKPEITILAEFGEELANLRPLISKILGEPMNMCVLPSDIGLCINLDQLTVLSHNTREFIAPKEIEVQGFENQLKYLKLTDVDRSNVGDVTKNAEIGDIPTTIKDFYQSSTKPPNPVAVELLESSLSTKDQIS